MRASDEGSRRTTPFMDTLRLLLDEKRIKQKYRDGRMHLACVCLLYFLISSPPKPYTRQFSAGSSTRSMNGDDGWETVPKKPSRRGNRAARPKHEPPSWFVELSPIPPPDNDEPEAPLSYKPFVLLLMGFPGSGKSTLATKLEEIMPWKYERVNQDDLGSRKACLRRAEQILANNMCPIIDRCNAGFAHRKPFYQLAAECKCPVDCIVLDASREICLERCRDRTGHPTVAPQDAAKVIGFMQKDWELPNPVKERQLRNIWQVSTVREDDVRELLLHLQ